MPNNLETYKMNKSIPLPFFVSSVLLIMVLNGMATNYCVDNTNASASNSNTGTSPSLPWLTIGKSASTIVAGDTCNVLAGGIRI